MARRPPAAETLGDLLRPMIVERRLTAWCEDHDLRPWTVSQLIDGASRPYRSTITKLAAALKVDEKRVRAACEASRTARQ